MLGDEFDQYQTTYESSRVLFHEGDEGESFYIIKDGLVEIYKPKENGTNEALIATIGPGETLGEMALLGDESARTASARTQSRVTCWEFNEKQFDKLMSSAEKFRKRIFKLLSGRLRETTSKLAGVHASKDTLYRAAFLIIHIIDEENWYEEKKRSITLNPSLKALASRFNIKAKKLEALLSTPNLTDLTRFPGHVQEELRENAETIIKQTMDSLEIQTSYEDETVDVDVDKDYEDLDEAAKTAEQLCAMLENEGDNLTREKYETIWDEYKKLKNRLEEAQSEATADAQSKRRLKAFIQGIQRHLRNIDPSDL